MKGSRLSLPAGIAPPGHQAEGAEVVLARYAHASSTQIPSCELRTATQMKSKGLRSPAARRRFAERVEHRPCLPPFSPLGVISACVQESRYLEQRFCAKNKEVLRDERYRERLAGRAGQYVGDKDWARITNPNRDTPVSGLRHNKKTGKFLLQRRYGRAPPRSHFKDYVLASDAMQVGSC
jgi:hypothetical protein